MIVIDGSFGEGGGQILRTSLGLSLVTGEPVKIERIRARRSTPGLMRQHLTAVKAAATVSAAEVSGAEVGSRELVFRPGPVAPGDYTFSISTAGSVTLVLQTVLPALMIASSPSRLTLRGGTHNPFAPPFDFLERSFLPIVDRMGPSIVARLVRPGFYPAGGGEFTVEITPAGRLEPFDLIDAGEVVERRAIARVANLPYHIAEREMATVGRRLGLPEESLRAETIVDSRGPGNVVLVEIVRERVTEIFSAFGQRGVRAEEVARRAADEAAGYLASGAAVGEHLADQLLVPMALAGGGAFSTVRPTEHTTTNIAVVERFLDVRFRLAEQPDGRFVVEVSS